MDAQKQRDEYPLDIDVELFDRRTQTCLSPFELNGEGREGQALVLRYAGCNLRCSLCYAWRCAWFPRKEGRSYSIQSVVEALDNLPTIAKKKIVWVRLQGGEPCLNYERIINTRAPLWDRDLDAIAVYPVADLGPSVDFDNIWITPVDPSFLPDEMVMFHHDSWSTSLKEALSNFRNAVSKYEVYKDFRNNPKTGGGRKIAIEELEPTKFQTSWISGHAGRYDQFGASVTPVFEILRRLSDTLDNQWKALTRDQKGITIEA
jgi:hypothetical protein